MLFLDVFHHHSSSGFGGFGGFVVFCHTCFFLFDLQAIPQTIGFVLAFFQLIGQRHNILVQLFELFLLHTGRLADGTDLFVFLFQFFSQLLQITLVPVSKRSRSKMSQHNTQNTTYKKTTNAGVRTRRKKSLFNPKLLKAVQRTSRLHTSATTTTTNRDHKVLRTAVL